MSRNTPRALVVVTLLFAAVTPVHAGNGNDPSAENQVSGGVVVHYVAGGGRLETSVDVPGDSSFSRSGGGGGGGVPVPCGEYRYLAKIADPLHPNFGKADPGVPDASGELGPTPGFGDPVVVRLESSLWEFTEVLDTSPVDDERQLQEFLYRDWDVEGWYRYRDNTQPLAELTRRFAMECLSVAGTGARVWQRNYLGVTDVPITDSFFGVDEAAQRLRARIDLDPIRVRAAPDPGVWGGLVVNSPTHLSIVDDPWGMYLDREPGRGVVVEQTVTPRSLDFRVSFTPLGSNTTTTETVECVTADDAESGGAGRVPVVPFDLPVFAVDDPGLACVWLPTERGNVSITATITYDVLIHINGHTRVETDYAWTSEPYDFYVGELRIVNTNNPTD